MLQEKWTEAKTWIDESKFRNPYEPFTLLSSALIEAQLGNSEIAVELAVEFAIECATEFIEYLQNVLYNLLYTYTFMDGGWGAGVQLL